MQYLESTIGSRADRRQPNGCLAYARLALEQQRAWPIGHSREEGAYHRQLSLAADNRTRYRRHGAPSRASLTLRQATTAVHPADRAPLSWSRYPWNYEIINKEIINKRLPI
jgi:hypothetical protein